VNAKPQQECLVVDNDDCDGVENKTELVFVMMRLMLMLIDQKTIVIIAAWCCVLFIRDFLSIKSDAMPPESQCLFPPHTCQGPRSGTPLPTD